MVSPKLPVLIILTLVHLDLIFSYKPKGGPSDMCLGCICEAASECDRDLGCDGQTCGMFRITYPYWADAGKPTLKGVRPSSPNAWVRCVTDPYCAGRTVIGYMNKFETDCNGDGNITCIDYARIHYLGGYDCSPNRQLDRVYERQFDNCLRFNNLK